MLQNLARCSYTRRVTANAVFGSSPSTAYASRRFYAVGLNRDIVNFLNKCAEKERSSIPKSPHKINRLAIAADAIEKLDFVVRHGDELKVVQGIGRVIRHQINVFLGQEKEDSPDELLKRKAVRKLSTIPTIGVKIAEELYDAGCDTIEKLRLEKYSKMLPPAGRRNLKYIEYLGSPASRKNIETIVEFCKYFLPMDQHEVIIAGNYRRGASAISEPIEIILVSESNTHPIPTPPHPSTLKPPGPFKPYRTRLPFAQVYITNKTRATSVLLTKIIEPLEDMGIVSETNKIAVNGWWGWMRVPKKDGTWESKKERIDGIRKLDGDFHRVNISYVPKQSRGSALITLTGDEDFYLECTRKAIQAGLYLNEWGLWKWEPDSKPLAPFQTSDASREKVSLGVMWGSKTEADKGRWVHLEFEEEQIFNAIMGEYVPPNERNIKCIRGYAAQKSFTAAKGP